MIRTRPEDYERLNYITSLIATATLLVKQGREPFPPTPINMGLLHWDFSCPKRKKLVLWVDGEKVAQLPTSLLLRLIEDGTILDLLEELID